MVAVHCKAGLGRTGVLIGAYLIWKYSFNANEVIGLMRVMRPGCVVGPQQQFIYENCQEWVKWGEQARAYKKAEKVIREEKKKMAAEIAKLQNQLREERSKKRKEVFDSQDRDSDSDEEVAKMFTPRPTKIATFAAGTSVGGAHLAATQAQSNAPSSAMPAYKPPPCVGQPRKSPSPSRKRPAALAPATVAKMGGRSENLFPTDSHLSGGNNDSEVMTASIRAVPPPQPAFLEGQHSATAFLEKSTASQKAEDKEEMIEAPETPSRSSRAGSPPKSSQINILGSAQGAKQEYPMRTSSQAAPTQGVLGEAHRLNMQQLPPALPTTPPTPKGGFFGRVERVVGTISATLSGTPPSPRQHDAPIARASPKVRDRYGLKDVSKLPRPASPVAVVASEAETLGIIGTIAPMPAMAPSPVKTRSRSMAHRGATATAVAAPVAPAARKRPAAVTATAPARTLSHATTRSVSGSSASSSGSTASRPGSRTAARHALSSTAAAPRSQRVAGTARPIATAKTSSATSSSQASATSTIPPRYTVKASSQPSYMAPTGASLKRSRGQLLTPDLAQEEIPAGSQRTASGRNVRPRRSNSLETLASAPAQASARR